MLSKRIIGYVTAFITLFLIGIVTGNVTVLVISLIPVFVIIVGMMIPVPDSIRIAMDEIPDTYRVGDIVTIHCKIEAGSGSGPVILSQKLPETFELVEGSNIKLLWKGFGKLSAEYRYRFRCSKRGEYTIEPVQWESSHLLGFINPKSAEVPETGKDITVKPKMLNVRRIRGIKSLATSPMPVIDIARMGVATTDFREIRNYNVGDPVRMINWKATARRASMGIPRPLVNEYEVEGKKMIWVFLDGSVNMQVGTAIENPFEYALEATNGVLHYYLDQGYKAGMYIYHHGGTLYYPDAGKRQFNKLSRELIDVKTSEIEESFSQAIDRCRRYMLGYNPFCIVITRLDSTSSESLIEGVKKLAKLRGRRKKGLPLMVISITGYNIIEPKGPYGEAAVKFRELETRPVFRHLRALGASVLEWNPGKTDFGTVLLRQVKTK
ncbi:MAG: DUF58 domain-containing protein [Dehalococcoidales bacterium]|nr:DUF58 domain-containing protein [Dehalococcoidales bacterium]